MKRDQHLALDKIVFGKEYPDVHKWLDASYYYLKQLGEPIEFYHWLDRHHLAAVEKQYAVASDEYAVACQHIIADFLSRFNLPILPPNRQAVYEILVNLKAIPNKGGNNG